MIFRALGVPPTLAFASLGVILAACSPGARSVATPAHEHAPATVAGWLEAAARGPLRRSLEYPVVTNEDFSVQWDNSGATLLYSNLDERTGESTNTRYRIDVATFESIWRGALSRVTASDCAANEKAARGSAAEPQHFSLGLVTASGPLDVSCVGPAWDVTAAALRELYDRVAARHGLPLPTCERGDEDACVLRKKTW